jgi:uncharacterized membrane protein YhhN
MIMIFIRLFVPKSSPWLWALVGAFLISIVGDWFLRTRTSDTGFILGIAGYFFAHVGFLLYGWKFITGRRKFSWIVMAIITVPLLIFYIFSLWPSDALRGNPALAAAVLVYLIISCLTLAVSIDIKSGTKPSWTWVYAAGVFCLLASDTLIALRHFVGYDTLYRLYMFPLFYTSYGLITASIIIKYFILKSHEKA